MTSVADVASLVKDAGGKVVGRTRLQKMAFVLEMAGLGSGFKFSYQKFGPYSEALANSARNATDLGLVKVVEKEASWGGKFSVYSSVSGAQSSASRARKELARLAARADAIELELAATALLLHKEGVANPWEETALRKPAKATDERLKKAKALYQSLAKVQTPKALPNIR